MDEQTKQWQEQQAALAQFQAMAAAGQQSSGGDTSGSGAAEQMTQQYQTQMAAYMQLMQAQQAAAQQQAATQQTTPGAAASTTAAASPAVLGGPDMTNTETNAAYLTAAAGAQQVMSTIEQYAEAVARNGIQFEAMAQRKHATDPAFSWLVDGGQYHDYYKSRVDHYKTAYGKKPASEGDDSKDVSGDEDEENKGDAAANSHPDGDIDGAPVSEATRVRHLVFKYMWRGDPPDTTIVAQDGIANVLAPLEHRASMDTIQSGRNWMLARRGHSLPILFFIHQHISQMCQLGNFQFALHLLYLIHDVFLAEPGFMDAGKNLLPWFVRTVYQAAPQDKKDAVSRLVCLWHERGAIDVTFKDDILLLCKTLDPLPEPLDPGRGGGRAAGGAAGGLMSPRAASHQNWNDGFDGGGWGGNENLDAGNSDHAWQGAGGAGFDGYSQAWGAAGGWQEDQKDQKKKALMAMMLMKKMQLMKGKGGGKGGGKNGDFAGGKGGWMPGKGGSFGGGKGGGPPPWMEQNTPESVPVGVMATMVRTVMKHDRNRTGTIFPYRPLIPELTPQQLPPMERPSNDLLDKIDDFYDDLIDDQLISKDKRPEPRQRMRPQSRSRSRSRSRSSSRENRRRRSRSRSRDGRRSPPRGGQQQQFRGGVVGGKGGGGSNLEKIEMMKSMMQGMIAKRNSSNNQNQSGGGANSEQLAAAQKVIQAAKLEK